MSKMKDQLKIEEIHAICSIARQAGDAIMAVYDTDFAANIKADQSPVTEADILADEIIRRGLMKIFPDIPIISEESGVDFFNNQRYDQFFLVDPLDGTKEFIKKNGEFTVNIAFIKDNRPCVGVVFAPALNVMYYASDELGAWKTTEYEVIPLKTDCSPTPNSVRVIASRSHSCMRLAGWLKNLPCEFEFLAAGSSLKFCRIAEGVADIYPRVQPTSQWDTAAAQCVLEAAGGTVLESTGAVLSYGLDRPLLNPSFVALGKLDYSLLFRNGFPE